MTLCIRVLLWNAHAAVTMLFCKPIHLLYNIHCTSRRIGYLFTRRARTKTKHYLIAWLGASGTSLCGWWLKCFCYLCWQHHKRLEETCISVHHLSLDAFVCKQLLFKVKLLIFRVKLLHVWTLVACLRHHWDEELCCFESFFRHQQMLILPRPPWIRWIVVPFFSVVIKWPSRKVTQWIYTAPLVLLQQT